MNPLQTEMRVEQHDVRADVVAEEVELRLARVLEHGADVLFLRSQQRFDRRAFEDVRHAQQRRLLRHDKQLLAVRVVALDVARHVAADAV